MIRWLAPFALLLAAAGCTTVASTAYSSATEERTVAEQASDTRIEAAVRKRIYDADSAKSAVSLDIFSYLGRVVIAGVAAADAPIRRQAPALAREVEGVTRVDSYWVAAQPSKTSDFTIKEKLKVKIVGDGDLKISQVDFTVLAGNVVLVGLVDRQGKVDRIVQHARSVEGVTGVRSFMQVRASK